MSYPTHIKNNAPEINLPYPRCTKNVIYDFFIITGEESTPRKVAICKNCKCEIKMIRGNNVYSSYTTSYATRPKWEDYAVFVPIHK